MANFGSGAYEYVQAAAEGRYGDAAIALSQDMGRIGTAAGLAAGVAGMARASGGTSAARSSSRATAGPSVQTTSRSVNPEGGRVVGYVDPANEAYNASKMVPGGDRTIGVGVAHGSESGLSTGVRKLSVADAAQDLVRQTPDASVNMWFACEAGKRNPVGLNPAQASAQATGRPFIATDTVVSIKSASTNAWYFHDAYGLRARVVGIE
jgi:hypothetical protein